MGIIRIEKGLFKIIEGLVERDAQKIGEGVAKATGGLV